MRNRIINGAMTIDQRNAGALNNPAVSGYTVDRWNYFQSQTSKGTIGQDAGAVTPPSGFTDYLGFTSTSAYSINSTDQFLIQQAIEGFNVADFGWGTANAKTVTLSFWVRSSLTGTFGGVFQNSASNRNYPFSYTISSANTWEQKSVTVAGDTTGTWLTTNGAGIKVVFSLGTGSTYSATAGAWTGSSFITSATGATSVVGTNGATFYITGVQLEVGTQATSFEYRQYGTELALCQRYFEIGGDDSIVHWSGNTNSGSTYYVAIPYIVTKRATPTVVNTNANNSGFSSTASTAFTGGKTVLRNSRSATSSTNGAYFGDTWTASAEL
jgi:hypothetical protein